MPVRIRTHTANVDVEPQMCPICGTEHNPVRVSHHIEAAKIAEEKYNVSI